MTTTSVIPHIPDSVVMLVLIIALFVIASKAQRALNRRGYIKPRKLDNTFDMQQFRKERERMHMVAFSPFGVTK